MLTITEEKLYERMRDAQKTANQQGREPIIAVDFDGTLCENSYPEIGGMNDELVEALCLFRDAGARLILWTNRCGERLNDAVRACGACGLEFDAVNENLPEMIELFGNNCRKIFADIYIDDKALHVEAGVRGSESP